MPQDRIYLNINGEPIIPINDHYYSLDTNSYIRDPTENGGKFIDYEKRVCSIGRDNFYLFYLANNITPSTPVYNSTNVEALPLEELYRLSEFTLEGLFTKARVLSFPSIKNNSIYIDLAFFVSSDFLSSYYIDEVMYKKKLARRSIPHFEDIGFFMKRKCRIEGVHVPTRDSREGEVLIEVVTSTLNELRNTVLVEFHDDISVSLYTSNKEQNITDYLIDYRHPEMGQLVLPC